VWDSAQAGKRIAGHKEPHALAGRHVLQATLLAAAAERGEKKKKKKERERERNFFAPNL